LRSGNSEQGIIIVLVAVVMLFVVGAMAALSIDVVTLYTARSEAQLAADAAALAAARVLANSGATSDITGAVLANVEASSGPAQTVAVQVARQNSVGGTPLTAANVTVDFAGSVAHPCNVVANPCVTVRVQRTDLPTFFARIWGRTTIAVGASATAEAYNPSAIVSGVSVTPALPVAPSCVKPWLLPNMDPSAAGYPLIFNAVTGAMVTTSLLGWVTPPPGPGAIRLRTDCAAPGSSDCAQASTLPMVWRYYPGTTDPTTGDFPAPGATCTGCTGYNNYQQSVAGCVQKTIACNQVVTIDQTADGARDADTADAVDSLTHAAGNGGDSVDASVLTPPTGTEPFQFLAGTRNPVVLTGALTADSAIMVSDSLVTVPVIDTTTATWPPAAFPQVQIIGFVQLFLNPTGQPVPASNHIHTQVINIVGCGTAGTAGQPILGNGASAVAVRLISAP
jgi:Flp pilus assembly protein TadG